MEWQDDGIVLAARRHGENDMLAILLTFEHGKHAGLVRGGAGKRLRPILDAGNRVDCRWRARLADHLGNYQIELVANQSARLFDNPMALAALAAACSVLDFSLPERDPHPRLFAALLRFLEIVSNEEAWPSAYTRFELLLLAELGFALDLEQCAVTGTKQDLAFVSPRTGRAVSTEGAGEFASKLLVLPKYLTGDAEPDNLQIAQGLRLAGFFLYRHVFEPTNRPVPPARDRLVELWQRRMERDA